MSDYISEKNPLNVRFTGGYELLKWILKKYKRQLPYDGEIIKYADHNFYSKDICYSWSRFGVQIRAWNCLNKDLMIAHLSGKIPEFKTFEELQKDFEDGVDWRD